jgi:hypothetical protein
VPSTQVNFKDKQRREWDELSSWPVRKLLSRLDSRAYTNALEEIILTQLGGKVDLAELQTALKYKKVNLKA